MSAVTAQVIIGACTVVISVGCSMFIAGTRWGTMNGQIRAINERLAKIEGMFTLRLKDPAE